MVMLRTIYFDNMVYSVWHLMLLYGLVLAGRSNTNLKENESIKYTCTVLFMKFPNFNFLKLEILTWTIIISLAWYDILKLLCCYSYSY